MYLDKLRARLKEVQEELRTLAELDADELTDDESARFEELEAVLEARHDVREDAERGLLDEIEREEKRQKLLERADDAVNRGAGETGDDRGVPAPNVNPRGDDPFDLRNIPAYGEARTREVRSRTLSAIEDSHRFVSDEHREQVTDLVQREGHQHGLAEFVLLGMDERYCDAFLRKMVGDDLSPEERDALGRRRDLARALSLSDVTGVLVPAHLDPQLILANDGAVNPFRQVCRTEVGVTNVYQSVRSGGVTSDWTPEATAVGDNAPSFANPTATAFKNTMFVPISFEAFEDARGRESDIVEMMVDRKDQDEALVLATGNGTDRPRGLITALVANTNSHVDNTTSNTFGLVDVYNTYERVPPRYRNDRLVGFANLSIINDVRQFGTDNYNTQTVTLQDRQRPAPFGYPLLEASAMDGEVTTAEPNNILAVGDPRTYLIYDRIGMAVEFVPNLFDTTTGRPTGQRGWVAHYRQGANLTVGHAASDPVVGFRLLRTLTN